MHQTYLATGVFRLEQMNFRGSKVGATTNVLIVSQDVLVGLMRLVLLVLIGITLLCDFHVQHDFVAPRSMHHGQIPGSKMLYGLLESLPCFACRHAGLNQHFPLNCHTPQGFLMISNAAHASE